MLLLTAEMAWSALLLAVVAVVTALELLDKAVEALLEAVFAVVTAELLDVTAVEL
jgi:hypothetical protein